MSGYLTMKKNTDKGSQNKENIRVESAGPNYRASIQDASHASALSDIEHPVGYHLSSYEPRTGRNYIMDG